MKRILTFFVLLALTACATPPSAPSGRSPDDPMFQFSGTWEGALDGHGGPHFVDGSGHSRSFRIIIDSHGNATVFQQLDSEWKEMKPPGSFRLTKWGSQAVVSSITSGRDDEGTWVENTSFTLVRHDQDTVVAYWLRTVNNLDLPTTHEDYHFAWGFSGKMSRVGDAATKRLHATRSKQRAREAQRWADMRTH
jgi:hypothetical protein